MDEAGALRRLRVGHHDQRALGFADDAALVELAGNIVISQDMLVENVDFRRRTFSAEDVGHKALAVNLSDIAAMGARPLGYVQALGVPPSVDEEWLAGYARGGAELAARYECALWGGDLSRAAEIVISITVLGQVARPLRRQMACVGDRLCVGGPLGAAAFGLALLESQTGGSPRMLLAQRRPEPQIELGLLLAQTPGVHGAMDLSDGLAADLPRFLQSGFGARIFAAQLPIPPELCGHPRAVDYALCGGEDFVLLAAVSPGTTIPGLIDIGCVDGSGRYLVQAANGDERPLAPGFDHFRGQA